MIDSLVVLAFLLLACGLGWGMVDRLDAGGRLLPLERLVTAFGLGGWVLYVGVAGIGPFRLDRLSMSGLVAVAAVAAVPGWRSLARQGRAWSAGFAADLRSPPVALLGLVTAGVALSSLLQGLAPVNDYDGLMYHATFPAIDVERGWMEPPWDRELGHAFFPSLLGNLCRLVMVFAGPGAAQMVGGLYGLFAALGAGALAQRLGFGRRVVLGSVLLLLAVRGVIWEMGTAEVDAALGVYLAAVLSVHMAWRPDRPVGLAVLLGLLLGAGLGVKYHGAVIALILGLVLAWDVVRQKRGWAALGLVPTVALAAVLPHMVRNLYYVANPLFPLFNPLFNPGQVAFYQGYELSYGTGRGLLDLLTAPWWLSVAPMQHFDGMVLGAPYLLALLPAGILVRRQLAPFGPALVMLAGYYLAWFYLLSQQIRFLMPILPVVTVVCAAGAAALWRATAGNRGLRLAFAALAGLLAVNQAAFVGIYAALRLPVALGLQSPADYHARTPTMTGAYYNSCTYVRNALKPGEMYIAMIGPFPLYCPQMSAILQTFPDEDPRWWLRSKRFASIDAAEFLERADRYPIRFIIVHTHVESRRNDTGESVVAGMPVNSYRFAPLFAPAIEGLQPLAQDAFGAVYDGPAVLDAVRRLAREGRYDAK
jgi:hypothetical protein